MGICPLCGSLKIMQPEQAQEKPTIPPLFLCGDCGEQFEEPAMIDEDMFKD